MTHNSTKTNRHKQRVSRKYHADHLGTTSVSVLVSYLVRLLKGVVRELECSTTHRGSVLSVNHTVWKDKPTSTCIGPVILSIVLLLIITDFDSIVHFPLVSKRCQEGTSIPRTNIVNLDDLPNDRRHADRIVETLGRKLRPERLTGF